MGKVNNIESVDIIPKIGYRSVRFGIGISDALIKVHAFGSWTISRMEEADIVSVVIKDVTNGIELSFSQEYDYRLESIDVFNPKAKIAGVEMVERKVTDVTGDLARNGIDVRYDSLFENDEDEKLEWFNADHICCQIFSIDGIVESVSLSPDFGSDDIPIWPTGG